jgi:Fe-S-cluster containining protein
MKINQKKLSSSQESGICLDCGECCKRYWITVLPEEANKLAKLLNISRKVFLAEYCELHIKLFPKSVQGTLTFSSSFFPQRIFDLVKKESAVVSESFFVVPQIVLRREQKTVFRFGERTKKESRNACVLLEPENACGVYSARPSPCKLFPFIAVPGFHEQYPFCELFQKSFKDFSIESRIYYKKIQNYFKEINDKGFSGFWRTPPQKGLVFLQDTLLGEISLKELEEMMPQR